MKPAFGIIAALVGLSAAIPYIISIIHGTTKPHRITWLIWSLLAAITVMSQLSEGAKWSVALAAAATFNNTLIFMLSIKKGVGGTNFKDIAALIIALLGIIVWVLTDQAIYALVAAVSGDAIGTLLTVEKAFLKPDTENGLTWIMATTASIFGLLAVDSYTFSQTLHPAYAVVGGSSILLAIYLGKLRFNKSQISV